MRRGTQKSARTAREFNMYGPDGIRAELMNFHAREAVLQPLHGGRSGEMRQVMLRDFY